MKKIKTLSEGPQYTTIELGNWEDLPQYSFLHPKLKSEVIGKVFTGEALKSGGSEISFTLLPPHTEIPFLHQHHNHEEIYVVIKGKGQFQVDGDIFPISEGSVVRVAPDGKRCWRNNSDEPIIMMVIQVQAGSLDQHSILDGYRSEGKPEWKG